MPLRAYMLQADDRLWLLRAVEAEGEPRRQVAQVLVNRFVWLFQRERVAYETLKSFVRAYCSPVNPRRMRGGDIWSRLYEKAAPAERKNLEDSHERRAKHCARTIFTQATIDAVDRALLHGGIDLDDPSATDFAAEYFRPGDHLELVQHGSRKPARNALYRVRHNEGWRGYGVTLIPRETLDDPRAPLLVAAVVLVGPVEGQEATDEIDEPQEGEA